MAPSWIPGLLGASWNRGSVAISRTLKHAKTPRGLDPARHMGLPVESRSVTTEDGVCLAAWYLPGCSSLSTTAAVSAGSDAEQVGAARVCVVLHHHYGGQKASLLPWMEFFHRMGLATFSFDARGHGASDSCPPGRGSFVHRAADVSAVCDEARRLGAASILAFGQSQGAAALVMGVRGRDDLLGCILDSGPAPDMGSAAWGLAGNMLGREGRERPLTRALLSARIIPGTQPLRYLGCLWWSLAALRSVPLLWLHGSLDRVIARRASRLWFEALRPSDGLWQGVEVSGAEHVRSLAVGGEPLKNSVAEFISGLLDV